MCLSYAYMELKHYSEAIDCINESFEYAGDKVPDLYFRRAQAVCYNKYSSDEDYKKALEDINKAIKLKKEKEPIYQEFLDKFKIVIETKKKEELEKITSKLNVKVGLIKKAKYSYEKAKEKNFSIDNFFFTDPKDIFTQYKILNE